jgi:DNA-binding GntR family transcriptional regulator
MLAREGLVAMSPYAGARVAGLDRDAILEVLYIRGHLEGIATRLAVPGFDEGSLLALTEVVDRMDAEAAKTEPDPMAYSRLNHDFHQLIFERCPNNRLRDLINSLWEGHSNFQTVFRLNPHRLTASLDEHHAILDAIRAGDAVLAGRLARNHKGLQKQDLLAVLGDDENDTDIEVEG